MDVHTADRYGSCEYQIATLEALDGDCHPNEKWVGGNITTTVLMYRQIVSASAIFSRGKLEIQVECRCCFISFFLSFLVITGAKRENQERWQIIHETVNLSRAQTIQGARRRRRRTRLNMRVTTAGLLLLPSSSSQGARWTFKKILQVDHLFSSPFSFSTPLRFVLYDTRLPSLQKTSATTFAEIVSAGLRTSLILCEWNIFFFEKRNKTSIHQGTCHLLLTSPTVYYRFVSYQFFVAVHTRRVRLCALQSISCTRKQIRR